MEKQETRIFIRKSPSVLMRYMSYCAKTARSLQCRLFSPRQCIKKETEWLIDLKLYREKFFFYFAFTRSQERPMDWRNEESDHSSVENFMWDEKSLTKSKSNVSISGVVGCNVSCQGVQVSFNGCKESRSFTSAFERLKLEAEIDCRNDEFSHRKTCDAQTETFDDFKQELIDGLKTKDSFFCRSVAQNSDILNFQGTRYSPEDIARYWKKDSRMWLWKSVRLRQRIKREQFDSTIKDEEERQ